MACAEGPRPYSENTTWGEVGRSGCVGWLVFNIAAFVARREATAAAHAAPRYNAEQMVVEQAAARLGKLQVLLKPLADDPIHGMMKIPAAELRDAAELLGSVVDGLRQADPDRPIKPDEWLRLLSSVEEERFIASSLLATTARRSSNDGN